MTTGDWAVLETDGFGWAAVAAVAALAGITASVLGAAVAAVAGFAVCGSVLAVGKEESAITLDDSGVMVTRGETSEIEPLEETDGEMLFAFCCAEIKSLGFIGGVIAGITFGLVGAVGV